LVISWRRGDRRAGSSVVERENGYEFLAKGQPEASIDEQATALLARLEPIVERIPLGAYDFVQLTCVVYSASPPAINFSAEVVAKLGRLGASIDVDLYLMPSSTQGEL
jgi:hypothetical protein